MRSHVGLCSRAWFAGSAANASAVYRLNQPVLEAHCFISRHSGIVGIAGTCVVGCAVVLRGVKGCKGACRAECAGALKAFKGAVRRVRRVSWNCMQQELVPTERGDVGGGPMSQCGLSGAVRKAFAGGSKTVFSGQCWLQMPFRKGKSRAAGLAYRVTSMHPSVSGSESRFTVFLLKSAVKRCGNSICMHDICIWCVPTAPLPPPAVGVRHAEDLGIQKSTSAYTWKY